MSSELQLDVRHLNRWRRHLVNAYEVKAGMVFIAGKLCDPCLSALKWFVYHARRYTSALLYLLPCHSPVPVPVVCLSTSDAVSCDHHVGPVQVHRHHPLLFYCVSEETSVVNSVCCVTVTLSLSVLS